MNLILARDYRGTDCSLGHLPLAELNLCTIERPWIPRAGAPCGLKGQSCVPAGVYQLMRHDSEAHPRTWALVNPNLWVYHWDTDVPAHQAGIARTLVLIHVANWASELRGCIAPGMARQIDDSGRRMVLQSAAAMRNLQSILPWTDGHTLEIRHAE